jgi:two-component system, LytTR family, response regulator
MTRLLLVDDEPLALLKLRQLLAKEPGVTVVGECRSARAALEFLETQGVDVMLVDVQMPEMSGLDLADALPRATRPHVIFVTAHDEFAIAAFELRALDYLLKPVRSSRLAEALARVRVPNDSRDARALQVIQVDAGDRSVFIETRDIAWIEGDANYVRVHAGAANYRYRATLRELETQLDPARFVRTHRSAIVNLGHVRDKSLWGSGDYLLTLRDGHQVRLSRSYRAEFDARTGRSPRAEV